MDASTVNELDAAGWHKLADLLKPETRCLIDGNFVPAKVVATFQTINPANGEVPADVARVTSADTAAALRSAGAPRPRR